MNTKLRFTDVTTDLLKTVGREASTYVINPKAFSDLQSTARLIFTPKRPQPPLLQRHADDSTLQNHSAKLMTLVSIVEEQGERCESVTRKTRQLSAGKSNALTQPALAALGKAASWKGGGRSSLETHSCCEMF